MMQNKPWSPSLGVKMLKCTHKIPPLVMFLFRSDFGLPIWYDVIDEKRPRQPAPDHKRQYADSMLQMEPLGNLLRSGWIYGTRWRVPWSCAVLQ